MSKKWLRTVSTSVHGKNKDYPYQNNLKLLIIALITMDGTPSEELPRKKKWRLPKKRRNKES